MSEFSISSSTTTKKTHVSSLILSDFFLFCAFILSHPIYFFYFIFFSPYLLKLLSFLSPLFITTFLLLLALLTFSSPNLVLDHKYCHPEFSESRVSSVLVGTYHTLIERLRSKVVEDGDDEFHNLEELDVYKIVFETSNLEENSVQTALEEQESSKENCLASTDDHEVYGTLDGLPQVLDGDLEGNLAVIDRPGNAQLIAEEKSSKGGFLHQKEELEDLWCKKEEKEVIKPLSVKSNKVDQEKEETFMISGSKALGGHKPSTTEANVLISNDVGGQYGPKLDYQKLEASHAWSPDNDGYYTPKVAENSDTSTRGSNLGSFGSMRKEKEWRRTLACKLFEERHNVVEGSEGMDLLWETYETDHSIKVRGKSKTKKGKKGNINDQYYNGDEEDEEDEDRGNNGQLCCLQALKFSAGKMNLGMGRPNLVKISKALKNIGWLHHVSRHGKKGSHH